MSPPLVSVVIPAYNRASTLARAIHSVQSQSLRDWELIVVDDASTDDTAAVLDELADDRVRCVRRPVNGGVAAAQNTGLDQAVGAYVSFLHSDDEFLPGRLSTLVDVLEHSSDVGGVESGFELVEPGRRTVRAPYLDGAGSRDLITYRVGVHISTLLLHRELAVAVRFDEALRGTEDRDFCIRLLRVAHLATRSEPLVRIHRARPRLGDQSKGPIYEYLLAKHADAIVPFPPVHAAWWFRISRAYARARRLDEARRAMRRSVRLHPGRVRRWPLFLASFISDGVFAAVLRGYLATARWENRRRSAPE